MSYAAQNAMYNRNDYKWVIFVNAIKTETVEGLKEKISQLMDHKGQSMS